MRRMTVWLALTLGALVGGVSAQEADPGEERSTVLLFPEEQRRPPRGEGWVVVEVPGGWMRFQDDASPGQIGPGRAGQPEGEGEGSLVIVPSEPTPPAEPPTALPPGGRPIPEEAPPEDEGEPQAGECPPGEDGAMMCPRPSAALDSCRTERNWLAQRLVELRGVFLDPDSAALVLDSFSRPFSGHLAMSIFGTQMPPVGGDTTLLSAVTWDLETQVRLRRLSRCLERQRR